MGTGPTESVVLKPSSGREAVMEVGSGSLLIDLYRINTFLNFTRLEHQTSSLTPVR